MTKKTIVVTGGSGFIGSHLVRSLKNDYRVLAPSHRLFDLTDPIAALRFFKKHPAHVVIHTALVGGSRPEEHREDSIRKNLEMYGNLMACARYFQKFIWFGSGAGYDKERNLVNIKESEFGKRIPRDDYGLFKYTAAELSAGSQKNTELRLFGLFGAGENYRLRFISNLMVRIILGKPITMYQDALFDYVYIEDLMKIVKFFIEHDAKYRAYNIGSGTRVSLSSIAKKVFEIAGVHPKVTFRKKGFNFQYSPDTTRLRKTLGNFSFTPLDRSLRELYDWYLLRKESLSL